MFAEAIYYAGALQLITRRAMWMAYESDVFNKFRDTNGEFKETVSNDVQGMLSLYEATYLKIRGEGFLDEAHAFTIAQLESLVGGPHLSSDLSEQVMHALKQSIHRGFPRLEAKHFISFYENDASRNETLLRLAKLDFNQLQLSHREELGHISRLDLTSKVPYARDRAVECFFWSTRAYYEPQHSVGRAVLTKIMLLLSVTDDTYDAYGTYDELKLYTNAVQRWDVSAMDELPDYMKAFYRALLNVYDEVDRDLAKQGRAYGVYHSKDAFKEIVRSYEIEAEWFKEGYVASFEEYMKNALVTSTGRLHTTSCFMGLEADVATTEAFEWILTKPKMVAASGAIGRLVDDEEQERAHVATGLDCYMKQHGVSKQEAIVELYKMIENAWRDINEEMIKPTAISMKLLIRVLNLSRISDVVYKYVDGYTHPEIIKDNVISLFEDPIPIRNDVVAEGGDVNRGRRSHVESEERRVGGDEDGEGSSGEEIEVEVGGSECVAEEVVASGSQHRQHRFEFLVWYGDDGDSDDGRRKNIRRKLQNPQLLGKMEQMNDHIRKLKLCLKWFQQVEKCHIKEREKLCNTLESAERKCTETEMHFSFARMVRVSVLNDALKSMYNAEKIGKRQLMIRPSSKVIIKFLIVMQKHGYIGEFEYVDDYRSGKIVVELNGRLNKCGVISPCFDVGVKEIEPWTARLLLSRQFGYIVLTTSTGIMDHEEARRKNVGGKQKLQYNDAPEDIEPEEIRPMGNYAISMTWPDGFTQVNRYFPSSSLLLVEYKRVKIAIYFCFCYPRKNHEGNFCF
ncbi:unnamed protein product [Camellia sinensis]